MFDSSLEVTFTTYLVSSITSHSIKYAVSTLTDIWKHLEVVEGVRLAYSAYGGSYQAIIIVKVIYEAIDACLVTAVIAKVGVILVRR
jgi:hypothetical protein